MSAEPIDLISVPVFGHTLFVARADTPLVPIRPICDVLGLAWQVQHRKLTSHPTFAPAVTMMVTTGRDGKLYEMVAMVAEMVPLWLATIHPDKVAAKVRNTLIAFQTKSAKLLYAAWVCATKGLPVHTGKRVNKDLFFQAARPTDWLEHPVVDDVMVLRHQEKVLTQGFKAERGEVRRKANALGRQVGLTAGQLDLLAWFAFSTPPASEQPSFAFEPGAEA